MSLCGEHVVPIIGQQIKNETKEKCNVPDEDCPRNTANSAIYLTRKTLNIKNSATSNCTYKISANFRLLSTTVKRKQCLLYCTYGSSNS